MALALPVAAATSAKAATPPLTLAGEKCTLDDADAQSNAKAPASLAIICGTEKVGLLVRTSDTVLPPEGPARKQDIALRIGAMLRTSANVRCDEPVDLLMAGRPLLAISCRSNVDGWPSLAIVDPRAEHLTFAYGPASAFPFLAYLAGVDTGTTPAAELARLAASLWQTPVPLGDPSDRQRIRDEWSAAQAAASQMDFATAQRRLETALELQTRLFGESDFTTAALMLDLAMITANQRDFAAARAMIRRAGPIIDASPRTADRARLAGYQASIAYMQGDFPAAARFAQDASEQWRKISGSGDQQALLSLLRTSDAPDTAATAELAMALAQEAAIALALDDPTSANAKASEALFTLNEATQHPPIWRSEILAILGETSIALGRLSASETYFRKAISIRRALLGDGAGTVRLHLALGRAYQREAMHENAIIAYRKAIKTAQQMPRGAVVLKVDDLVPFVEAVLDHAETLENRDEKLGLLTELYDAFQMAWVPDRDESVNLASISIADGDPAFADAVAALQQGMREEAALRGKLGAEQAKASDEQDAAATERLATALTGQMAATKALREDLVSRYPAYRRFAEGELPSLDTLRASLAPGEVLATFLIGTRKSFIQLVSRERLYIAPISAGEDDLGAMVRSLRKGLEIEGGSISEFDLEEAHVAYEKLFGGVAEPLDLARRLIVVPSKPLSSLPFSLLVTAPTKGTDYANAPWLVRRLTVAQAPSIASFINLRATRRSAPPSRPFLGIANPRFAPAAGGKPAPQDRSCDPGGLALPARFDSLARLPETEDELRSVIASLRLEGAELHTGRDAGEQVFRSPDLGDYNIIYAATHAVMPGEVTCQTEPGMALARPASPPRSRAEDGFLDASEVAALRISASLVVLSACNTATSGDAGSGEQGSGRPGVARGDALSGLAESFFIAGARSLLVTHWQVPSSATASLMRTMFGAIGQDRSLATDEALRRAQLAAIRDPATAHPFFWGAFSFVGSGAETLFKPGTAP